MRPFEFFINDANKQQHALYYGLQWFLQLWNLVAVV